MTPFGENRGGTPIGVRIPLDARPCQRHGRMKMRLPAFRILLLWIAFGCFGEAGLSGERKAGTTLAFPLPHPSSRFT
jgi:hypothetical protein